MPTPVIPMRRGQPRATRRGQALVEFALILPILALLLVMAVDFGRVFFGWVGLQNIARIGANFAAIHPDAFNPATPNSPSKLLLVGEYNNEIVNDVGALNCAPRPTLAPSPTNIPQPSFVDANSNGNSYDLGDQATVTVTCRFSLITPLANAIFGGGVNIGGSAVFTLRGGAIASIPTPAVLPTPTASPTPTSSGSSTPTPSPSPSSSLCPPPVAAFTANTTSGNAPLTVQFNDNSATGGCPVITWAWNFGDGSPVVTVQNPSHTYTTRGQYSVTLVISTAGGSNSTNQNNYVHVR